MATTMHFFNRLASADAAGELDWDSSYASDLPRIYNFFRYRVGDSDLAEDLTAETFEKAWRARERYRRDRAAFSTWLFTIARNVAADHFRRHRDELPLDDCRLHPSEQDLGDLAELRAEQALLSALLAELPARERELIALKYGAGLNNREIARLTTLSESNVGTILNRVTARLRERWKQAMNMEVS